MTFGTVKVVRSSPLLTGRLYLQEYPGTHFQRLSRPRGTVQSVATEKFSSDISGDRSRDPPTSSAVPEPLRYPRPVSCWFDHPNNIGDGDGSGVQYVGRRREM